MTQPGLCEPQGWRDLLDEIRNGKLTGYCMYCAGQIVNYGPHAQCYIAVKQSLRSVAAPAVEEGKKYDTGKLRYDLVPYKGLEEVIKVIGFGASKYGDENWRLVKNGRRRYFAAAMRHMVAFFAGQWADPETGLPHLAHAACNMLFILEHSECQPQATTPTLTQH